MTRSDRVAFDPAALLARSVEIRQDWSRRDTMLYALGVGATELPFIYEDRLTALPTMGVVLGYPGFDFWTDPALGIDTGRILHGETEVEILDALPVEGRMIGTTRVDAIYDKGADKGAVVLQRREITDGSGRHFATVRNTSMLRGNGGFGGQAEGQPQPRPVPERPADAVVILATLPSQAQLYRLSGDYNPLHIDPAAARAAGFPQPILHGLCTFGIAGRAVLQGLTYGEPAALRRIGVRFSTPCFPGETLQTEIWQEEAGHAAFRTIAVERGVTVLNNGYAEVA